MKKIIFINLLFLCATSTYSQVERQDVDSLVNVLENSQLTNKEKIELYNKIVGNYVLFDLDKASEYSEMGLSLAEKEGDKLMASHFNAYFGRIYNSKSNFDTALNYWNKALNLAIAINNKEQEASAYRGIGILYLQQEQQSLGLEYFIKSLAIYENIGNKIQSMTMLANIGVFYINLKNFEKALYYFEKQKQIAEELNNDFGKMQSYQGLGSIYYYEKDYERSLELVLKAFEISNKLNDRNSQVVCTSILASIYKNHFKDYDVAWKYANESLQFAENIGDPQYIAGALRTMSTILLNMKKYEECETFALKALTMDSTTVNTIIDLYENLVISYLLLNKNADAAKYHDLYTKTVKKHIDLNNRELIANMETKYQTEKKEMQIVSLEKERQMYIWLGIAGALFAIALGVVLWLRIRSVRKEKQLIATRSVLDGEMGERSRLARDLHDRLSGNLSAVKMGIKDDRESILSIQDKLDKCIEEIRRVAHNLMPASLQFGLKVALGDYTAQFQNVQFHFFGEEKRVEDRIEFVAYCCASELVNNSLRHSGANNINLQLIQSEKHISITVQDDGCGFDENSVTKGFGMKSIHDRIASCNGKVDVSSSPGKGTETTIEIKSEK